MKKLYLTFIFVLLVFFFGSLSIAKTTILSWDKVLDQDLEGYILSRGILNCDAQGPLQDLITLSDKTLTTYTDSTVPEDAPEACYRLSSFDYSKNRSAESSQVTKKFTLPGVIAPPSDLILKSKTATTFEFDWTRVDDGTGTNTLAKSDLRYSLPTISWGSASRINCYIPPCTISGLTPSTDYEFMRVNFSGEQDVNAKFSTLSQVWKFRTADEILPSITVTPILLKYSGVTGSTVQSQTVVVSNSGQGILSWTATTTAPWLKLTTTQTTIVAAITATGLASGVYHSIITITDPKASNSPVSIPVTLTVTDPVPIFSFTKKTDKNYVVSWPANKCPGGVTKSQNKIVDGIGTFTITCK